MIDLHSHIIFGVDDGPKTLEESIQLIGLAYDQGVRHIVATSHRRKGLFETPEHQILEHFLLVNSRASEQFPDLTLSYGGELYYTPSLLTQLEEQSVPTLNGTRFVLIEFSSHTPYKEIDQAVSRISLLGLTPLLAHIERYDDLAFDDKKVQALLDKGAYTQINSLSVLKPKLLGDSSKEFKKRAQFFLEKDLVHVIASDMHNLTTRKPYMKEAFDRIAKTYGAVRAENLFVTNPSDLLNNQYL